LRLVAFFVAILFYQTFLCIVKWNILIPKASLNVLLAKHIRNNINNVLSLDFNGIPIKIHNVGTFWVNNIAVFVCHISIIALDIEFCMPYNGVRNITEGVPVGRIADLDGQGVTDLTSYLIGIMNERDRFLAILDAEQKRSNLGFVQYDVLRKLIESSDGKSSAV